MFVASPMHVNLNLSQLVFVNMSMPFTPKIYHIVHVDRLASILASNGLLCRMLALIILRIEVIYLSCMS